MQRFKNIIGFITIPLMVVSFFSCHAQKKTGKLSETQEAIVDTFEASKNKKGDLVPIFDYITASGEEKSTKDLIKGQSVLLVLFNPSCGHCQTLLEQVRDNIAIFDKINIIFLTGEPLKNVLPNYVKNVKVDKMKEINVVSDNSDITLKIFEYYGIPQIMLYNKDHKLEHIYYKDATNKQMLTHLRK